jgi:hypothetical protein
MFQGNYCVHILYRRVCQSNQEQINKKYVEILLFKVRRFVTQNEAIPDFRQTDRYTVVSL